MDIKGLTFGVGLLLRENVSGWATSDSGVNHVYPDHPPLDLSKTSYPRATVDVIGQEPGDNDIEKTAFTGDALVDITVYAVNSEEVVRLLGDSVQAVIDHWDGDADSGDPYLDGWYFEEIGITNPVENDKASKGFTRYHKTQELTFSHVTTKT